jgi:hypothetical protein
MFTKDTLIKILGVVALGLGLVFVIRAGCGTRVKPRTVNPFQVDPAEVEKVKRHLEEAGIEGQVVSIQPETETYLVLVIEAPTNAGGQRPKPPVTASYRVNKKTGKVTSAM